MALILERGGARKRVWLFNAHVALPSYHIAATHQLRADSGDASQEERWEEERREGEGSQEGASPSKQD